MYFIRGLDSIATVTAIRDSIDALLMKGSFTSEYTIGGTDVRKAMVIPAKDLGFWRDECNEFLIQEVLGIPTSRNTQTFIGS